MAQQKSLFKVGVWPHQKDQTRDLGDSGSHTSVFLEMELIHVSNQSIVPT